MQEYDIVTIHQMLSRELRKGSPILPILMENYFDEDLLDMYAQFELIHHDLFDKEIEEAAYSDYLEDLDTGLFTDPVPFDEIHDGEFSDHYSIEILQSLLNQMHDQDKKDGEPDRYILLRSIVNYILDNYTKIVAISETGDGTQVTFADGETSDFIRI